MKKFSKIVPMLMALAVSSTTLFATETVSGFGEQIVTSNTYSLDDHHRLSGQYPELSEYIVSINKSVEFGGIRFTLDEVLIVGNKVQMTATSQMIDGSKFEMSSGYSSIDVEKKPTSEEGQLATVIVKMINSMDSSFFATLSADEIDALMNFLSISMEDSFSAGSFGTYSSNDNSKLYHMIGAEYSPNASNWQGETFVVSISELGYHNHLIENIDIDLRELYEQTKELDILTIHNIGENGVEMPLNYQISDNVILERVQYYTNDEGENILDLLTKDVSNNNFSQLFTLGIGDNPDVYSNSSWRSNGVHFQSYILGDYTVEDVQLVLNTTEYIVINDASAELEFDMPSISVPIISTETNVQIINSNETVIDVNLVKVSPFELSISGSYYKETDSNYGYQGEAPDLIEILFADGTTEELFRKGQTISTSDNYDTKFVYNYAFEDFTQTFDINNIKGVVFQGDTVLF